MDGMNRANRLLEALEAAYRDFTADSEANGKSMFSGLRRFVMGSKGSADALLCEQFHKRVSEQVTALLEILPELSREDQETVSARAAEIMLSPRRSGVDPSRELMFRAEAGQFEPLLPYLSRDCLSHWRDTISQAYPPRQRFPVEKQLLRCMDERLGDQNG